MKKNIFSSLLFFFLIHFCGNAQTPYFQHYFPLKKNEPIQINQIFQDETGFIWFGTSKGLFKYNGKNFKRYTQADGLPDDNVTAVSQDSTGKIWCGHRSGAVSFLSKEKFLLFSPEDISAAAPVSDILFDKQGTLWFATLNDGLYYYKRERLYRLDEEEGMPDLYVYDLEQDSTGNIWAGTDGGLVQCSWDSDAVKITVLNNESGLADNIVKKLALAEDQTIWMATEDAGLIRLDPRTKKFDLLMEKWTNGSVTDFLIDGKKIWISTVHPGLCVYDTERKKSKLFNVGSSSDADSFLALLKDLEGNIWAGSRTGVSRTPGDHLTFIESFESAKNINVVAVAADNQGDLWYATADGLFKRTIAESGSVSLKSFLAGTPFQKFNIISLFVDAEGFVWAGLFGQGVLRINSLTGKIKHLSKEFRNGNVLQITGKGSTLWLATLGGIEQITVSGDDFTVKNYNQNNGLSSDFIYQVFVDSHERVWLATDGKGVDMIDQTGIHHIEAGLPSKVVYGFAEDAKHRLWVNVQGNGIYRLEKDHFLPMDSVTRLRDNNVSCFSSDPSGSLVIMHDLGLDVFDVNRNKVRYFDEETGVHNKRATLNAVAKDSEGNLFIGTDGGIVKYSSSDVVLGAEPNIAIEAFKVFDQKTDLTAIPFLKHDENSITIQFFGLWFQNPENLQFLYKLTNYDEQWLSTGDNAVTYSRLPPGDYIFDVKVSDNPDFTHAQQASIQFAIRPPIWRTWPFYISCLIIFIAGAYTIVKYRERKLLKDKLLLEVKVEERTREIQMKTEEIQAQNEEIMSQAEEIKGINENLEMLVHQRTGELEKKNKALEEYAFINAHKLRSPLASILGLIHLLAKTNLGDEAKEINRHLQQRADELDDVVRSITKAIERGEK